MSGTTPNRKVPYALPGDAMVDWPSTAKALADLLDKVVIPQNSLTNATTVPSYPLGFSVMNLGTAGAQSGGWPRGLSSMVFTFKPGSDRALQIWAANNTNSPQVLMRNGQTTVWSAWRPVIDVGLAQAMFVGRWTFPASSAYASQQIQFPAGRFSTPPNVVASGATRDCFISATSITVDGFSLNIGPVDGAPATERTVSFHAIETAF